MTPLSSEELAIIKKLEKEKSERDSNKERKGIRFARIVGIITGTMACNVGITTLLFKLFGVIK